MVSRNYLGFDLSTQQLKAIVISDDLKVLYEAKVDFDADLPHYGTSKGVLSNAEEHEIFAPVSMWLEAVDLVLERLEKQTCDFSTVMGISGAGMQHGTVYWAFGAEKVMKGLDPQSSLVRGLKVTKDSKEGAFSHEFSPNWQDASTQGECEQFDAILGGPEMLAKATGSSAHHRFSGPQIMRFKKKLPQKYAETARISLVSSFLASILLGEIAPIDRADVGGMNLQNIENGSWNDQLLQLMAGSKEGAEELRKKLGNVSNESNISLGKISHYFVHKYGFQYDCSILPFTGDNPSTITALPMRENEAIVSLGTSTTFLMSTSRYNPDPSYHFMNHPTTPGLYMFMLCYKNGALVREEIRDAINQNSSGSWTKFNSLATTSPPLGQDTPNDDMKLGLYFSRPEIVPNVHAGLWRIRYNTHSNTLVTNPQGNPTGWTLPDNDARAILESQFLSMRLRSAKLVSTPKAHSDQPAQPSRIYLVGGGSQNPAITSVCSEVLGGADGVFKLDIGGNACALGAAYKAVWGCEGRQGESFQSFIGSRWREEGFVQKVADGYQRGVWERYGDALRGFELLEREVVGFAGMGN